MARVIDPLRLRDTRCVPLDRYGLDRMKPGLIVVKGHPGLFAQAKDQKRVPQVHLPVPVMEDGILYNLPNIEWDILEDGEVEQGMLGCHLTHIRRRDKTRSDEVMPNLGNVGQMLGLKIYRMARTVDPPLTPAFGQYADDLKVVEVLVELIKGPWRDMLKAIEAIDQLRTEVDQYTSHPDLFEDMGGEVGVKFSNYAHRRWTRGLA